MMRTCLYSERGTVLLVALCFVTVLGISLAGYVAICARTMQISNRTYQADSSRQLAEMGLEEALRAFNKHLLSGTDTTAALADWSNAGVTVNWNLDTTNKRATATMSLPTSKFGQGTTASVKIRVDNYTANQPDTPIWNASTTYRINDLIAYGTDGIWYRSVQNGNTGNQPSNSLGYPNLANWAPEPIPWSWIANKIYTADYDVVCNGGTWYRCTTTHTSGTSFSAANWASMPAPVLAVITNTAYTAGTFAFRVGDSTWYRCLANHTVGSTWDPTASNWESVATATRRIPWAYLNTSTYSFNDLVFYSSTAGTGGTWYRYINATSSSSVPTNTTYWEPALSGINTTSLPGTSGWSSSGIKYNPGDVVYYSGTGRWYRCILAHPSATSSTPASTIYWSSVPMRSSNWDAGRQYVFDDTTYYNGIWYRCILTNNNTNPAGNPTYWASAANSAYYWNSATNYTNTTAAATGYVSYGGVWYDCTAANTGQPPNNSSYWTALGAAVVYAEGTLTISGSPSVKTQLRATLALAPLFPNAAASTTTINATSGGTIDSYDSGLGTTYTSQIGSATNFSATVAAAGSITLSSTAVKGYLAWPTPPAGIGGSVKSFTSPGSPNIDPTRLSRSPYIPQFDPLPRGGLATNWSTTPKGTALALAATVNIGTPGAVTPSRYYYNGDLTIGGPSIQYLKINGPVILYINGDLFISNPNSTGRIDISTTGSAEIHLAGEFKADAGGEGIVNQTADPKKLIIISDTTSSFSHFYSEGINPLHGVIYVPYTTSIDGYYNNNNGAQIYGAISAKKITYSGANMNIHYDTQLRYTTFGGVEQPYGISEWRELPSTERAVLP
jgi:hypothetical protein